MTMIETQETTTTWQDAAAASAEAQAEPPARKTVRRLVKQRLTDAAKADLGGQLAQEEIDLQAIETLRKAENAKWREEITEVKTRIKGLTEAIRSGTAVAEIECFERFDPDTNTTELVALDGTILEPATDVPADKRQLTLAEAKGNGHAEEDDFDEESAGQADFPDDPADASLDGDEPSTPALDGVRFDESWKHATDPDDEPAAGDVVITEPEAILDGAAEEVTAADAPMPKRRGRGKR